MYLKTTLQISAWWILTIMKYIQLEFRKLKQKEDPTLQTRVLNGTHAEL